ncbi:MAG: hypothetical protein KA715_10875 [Xanthomonadaceae bacterium]|nr:hypothetical protein [Xanthomonadaceae bacterium]
MPQKEVIENEVKKLLITVSVRCKDHPNGRIQLKRRFDGISVGSQKANTLERDLLREAEREKAQRENDGTTWETLLSLYDVHVRDQLQKGDWCQGRQTYDEAIRALHNWTSNWYQETAARISAPDVTKLFHQMKE